MIPQNKLKDLIGNLIDEAKWVVDAFDQANTNKAIVNLGSRGQIAADAINDLRKALREAGHPSTLPDKQ